MGKSEKEMSKFVKNGVEFGVGVAYITTKALAKAVDTLAERGNISDKEAERLVRQTVQKYQDQSSAYAKQVSTQIQGLMKKASPFVTKKDMDMLKSQIDSISKSLNKRKK
jgi:polyhydroxyalkanoate synthesis regulator phasin